MVTPAVSFTRTLSSCPSVLLPHLLLPCPLEPGVPGDGAAGFWGELPTGDRGPDRFSLCRRLPADLAPPADGDGAQPARPAPPVPALPAGLEQLRSQLAGAGEGNVLVGGCWQHRTSGGEGCRSRPWFLGLTRNKSLRRDQKTTCLFPSEVFGECRTASLMRGRTAMVTSGISLLLGAGCDVAPGRESTES